MNEPKKRGRPVKQWSSTANPAVVPEQFYDAPEMVNLAPKMKFSTFPSAAIGGRKIEPGESVQIFVDPLTTKLAQAYALRVWSGQSVTAERNWRIARVMEALEGQNLPTDGVELP